MAGISSGRRVRLTQENVEAATPGERERHIWDSGVSGFALRLRPPSASNPQGVKTFVFVYRWPAGRAGKKQRISLKANTVAAARKAAAGLYAKVNAGIDPREEKRAQQAAAKATGNTLSVLADTFIERYAKPRNRSWKETQRIFDRYVKPTLGNKPVASIRRIDIAELLDGIVKNNGAVQADRVLAAVRKLFRWHATRDDTFNSPIVPGMARTRPKDIARKRVLTDDEIRRIWKATETTPGPYGALVRFVFLTATRREESSLAIWSEIDGDLFAVPAERSKSKQAHFVPLSKLARDVLASLPRFESDGKPSPWVFSYGGRKAFNSHSEAKAALDKASGVKGWVLHDLRRTARTLMSRAGIPSEHAERVLGHTIPGVEGVYDRYSYLPEKRHALNALATEITNIINPPGSKVVPIRSKRKGGGK